MVSLRELEILEKVALGFTTKQIATELYLSDHTIVSHKKNLLEKLDAVNSPDMVRKGFLLGLLKLDD